MKMFSTRHFITLMVIALILVSQSFTSKMEIKDAKDVKEAFDKMFSKADENKDGQLSKEEARELLRECWPQKLKRLHF